MGCFDLETLRHTGIMLFVNCPTSSMYVNESIVFGILMELCFFGYKTVFTWVKSRGLESLLTCSPLGAHCAMDSMLI